MTARQPSVPKWMGIGFLLEKLVPSILSPKF